jgi:hypothetical protein
MDRDPGNEGYKVPKSEDKLLADFMTGVEELGSIEKIKQWRRNAIEEAERDGECRCILLPELGRSW